MNFTRHESTEPCVYREKGSKTKTKSKGEERDDREKDEKQVYVCLGYPQFPFLAR